MPDEKPLDYYGLDLGDNYGGYDTSSLYGDPPEIDYNDFGDYPHNGEDDENDAPAMYWTEIGSTTTVPPDMYPFLFESLRNRIKSPGGDPVRKGGLVNYTKQKFNAAALKEAYAQMLEKSPPRRRTAEPQNPSRVKVTIPKLPSGTSRSPRVTRSVLDDFETAARQFLHRWRGKTRPRIIGLLDRRAPILFRQNSFVRISLSQFAIVSTGATGKMSKSSTLSIATLGDEIIVFS